MLRFKPVFKVNPVMTCRDFEHTDVFGLRTCSFHAYVRNRNIDVKQ